LKKDDGTEATLPGFEGVFGKQNAYSTDNFFSFVYDFNGDGWNDVLTYGLPGTPPIFTSTHRVKNSIGKGTMSSMQWTTNRPPSRTSPETESRKSSATLAAPLASRRQTGTTSPPSGLFTAISGNGDWQRFTHGLGVGDVNGDGRPDILDRGGWWERPRSSGAGSDGCAIPRHSVPAAARRCTLMM
jgi:hypothetical protein